MSNDDRLKAIIERITKDLESEGYSRKNIDHQSKESYGSNRSFFDILIDMRLEGNKTQLTAEEVFENMKPHINYLEGLIRGVSKDYRNLEVKYKHLKTDYEEMVRENSKKKP